MPEGDARRLMGLALWQLQRYRWLGHGRPIHCFCTYAWTVTRCRLRSDFVQDMGAFCQQCNRAGTLSRLRSITLTVDEHTSLAQWQQHVLDLLSNAPLQRFHISTVGGHVGHRLSDDFCKAIVSAHGHRLTRFSVHRMRMSIDAIADICRRCTALQQLFIVVEQNDLVRPASKP